MHSQGNLAKALQVYEQVLRLEPKHFDALHHTGIAAFQSGNFDAAVGFFRSALEIDPLHASALNNLGNALRELQMMEDALRCYDRALAQAPEDANTHFNRAVTLQSLMRTEDALHAYEQTLGIEVGDDQAWANRAALLWQTKQFDQALTNVEQALALNPQNIEASNVRGHILQSMGQAEEAEESYRQAVALAPEYAEAHYALGCLLLAQGRHAEALSCLSQACSLHPQYVPAQRQRAMALRALHQPEQAQQAESITLMLQGQQVAAYRQRGIELEQQLHFESAAAMYASALELDSDNTELQQLHARALKNTKQNEIVLDKLQQALQLRVERAARLGATEFVEQSDLQRDHESARIAFEKLTKLAPRNLYAYVNLGNVLQALGLRDLAMEKYQRALEIKPGMPAALWNLSLIQLARGDYEQGWRSYESRWHFKELPLYKFKRHFLKPQWTGREALRGKTILVYAEQGFGDAIQFCRYLRMVKQRGAHVILEVNKTLVGLMGTLEGVDQIVDLGSSLPAFDYQIPMLSLPLAFNTRVDTIPPGDPYLRSDPEKREQWQQFLGPKKRPRVGVVWSGSGIHGNDHNRSLPLSVLASTFSEEYEFICLQKEIRNEDRQLLETLPVRLVSERLHDFGDTAALCDLMDVVLTVDTSVAHLAGALGKPLWVMLPTPFEWRWLEHGATSPWYPSATLYRQEQIGDWTPVIDAVVVDLKKLPR